jgi:hypothetical protein
MPVWEFLSARSLLSFFLSVPLHLPLRHSITFLPLCAVSLLPM